MSDQLYTSNNVSGTNIITGSASVADVTLIILVATGTGTLSGTVQTYSLGDNSAATGTVSVNGLAVSAAVNLGSTSVVGIPITTPTALVAGDLVALTLSVAVAAATQLSATATIS